jgi:hypothetical protein
MAKRPVTPARRRGDLGREIRLLAVNAFAERIALEAHEPTVRQTLSPLPSRPGRCSCSDRDIGLIEQADFLVEV